MPRVARIVVPGTPHHVTQRGNNRQQVFFCDPDRELYLRLLKEHAERFGVEIVGWCLMTNHMHLVAVPAEKDSLAKAVGRTDYRYTQALNRARGWTGHLWQNRFFSCPLDEGHTWQALCYVDRNPVRAGVVREARRYYWSSAAGHCGGKDPAGLVQPAAWRKLCRCEEWSKVLRREEEEDALAQIRRQTQTGRAWGSQAFVAHLESATGRTLRVGPVGRPRKTIETKRKRRSATK